MKTLKTLSTAFVVALLVSVVSAPAMMETVKVPFVWVAKKAVLAKDFVAGPVKSYVVGNAEGDKAGIPGVQHAFDLCVRNQYGKWVTATAATAAVVYAGYNYLTAEEETPADKQVQKTTKPVDAPKVEAPKVEAPKVEAPKVEAPKPVVRNPRANKNVRRNVRRNAPAKRTAKANCKNGRCRVR